MTEIEVSFKSLYFGSDEAPIILQGSAAEIFKLLSRPAQARFLSNLEAVQANAADIYGIKIKS